MNDRELCGFGGRRSRKITILIKLFAPETQKGSNENRLMRKKAANNGIEVSARGRSS